MVPVPSTVPPALFSLMLPMARACRIRRTVTRRDRVVVVGGGVQALVCGAALEGPGRRVLADSGEFGQTPLLGFHHREVQVDRLLERLEGAPDLVILAQDTPLAAEVLSRLGWGATVVSLVPCTSRIFADIHHKEVAWLDQRSVAPEDLIAARSRLEEVRGYLERLPREEFKMEAWPGCQSFDALWAVVQSCDPSF